MKYYIVDASFVVKALLSDKTSIIEQFENILMQQKRGEAKICSSFLLALEVANALRFSLKDEKMMEETFEKLSFLEIEYLNLNFPQITSALRLSHKLRTTVYDTSYHFLAKLLGGEFYTCDKEYFQKAEKEENIVLVK